MSVLSPYQPLEVIETKDRRDGLRYWVRDAEETYFQLVEYVERRLMCWCEEGFARHESPDTEQECAHLRAVVELREVESRRVGSSRAPINVSAWID